MGSMHAFGHRNCYIRNRSLTTCTNHKRVPNRAVQTTLAWLSAHYALGGCSDFVTPSTAKKPVCPILGARRFCDLFRVGEFPPNRLITSVPEVLCRAGLDLFCIRKCTRQTKAYWRASVSNCHSWKGVTGSCG